MDVNRARPVGRYGAGDSGAAGAGGEGDAPYIWLRYSTQCTTGGRTHTIEMEVPVPVGASAELREQLIREAEANMEHLYRRVEARAARAATGRKRPAQRRGTAVRPTGTAAVASASTVTTCTASSTGSATATTAICSGSISAACSHINVFTRRYR